MISGFLVGVLAYDEWIDLSLAKQIILWALFIDISGGVVVNLTKAADQFYQHHSRKRSFFILIHIQPIIITWMMEIPLHYGIALYVYTAIGALFLNTIRQHTIHKPTTGALTALGFIVVVYWGQTMPLFVTILFLFYLFKVLYSFSVCHYE
ncbi:hypothetical protein [Pelagirhabdus alkalitolerans]|nr:hypothetical protein [Pelagirhabdus alkalitolerans]